MSGDWRGADKNAKLAAMRRLAALANARNLAACPGIAYSSLMQPRLLDSVFLSPNALRDLCFTAEPQ